VSFFEWQRVAKRQTYVLYLGLIFAILSAPAALALYIVFGALTAEHWIFHLFWEIYAWSMLVTLPLILGSMFYRMHSLTRQGACKVAQMMGAKELVKPNTFLEKRYVNVVEEISIAAGIPTPQIYLLEDDSINAFAAGYSIKDGLVCVTRGCLNIMPRESLEAVVAHEIGHIVHSDTKVNLKAMSVVFGMSVLSQIGLTWQSTFSTESRYVKENGIAALGWVLYMVGYLGGLASQLVQALLSRVREYHADASAVQFTRNPRALANAFKIIGGSEVGTKLDYPAASEMRHMFFCEAASLWSERVFATHPPIDKRIFKLEPSWDLGYLFPDSQEDRLLSHAQEEADRAVGSTEAVADDLAVLTGAAAFSLLKFSAEEVDRAFRQAGNPENQHLTYARQLMHSLPFQITTLLHSEGSVAAILFALLLSDDQEVQLQQIAKINAVMPSQSMPALQAKEALDRAKIYDHLSLFDLTVPALRRLDKKSFEDILNVQTALIQADKIVSLFEWCLFAMSKALFRVLYVPGEQQGFVNRYKLKDVPAAIAMIIKVLCLTSGQAREGYTKIFDQASTMMHMPLDMPEDKVQFKAFGKALRQCEQLKEFDRQMLVEVCVKTVGFDDVVMLKEAQLLRVIATLLGCPIPPIVQRQSAVED
jgi:Zn-dependent protease with chaperone function